MSAGSPSSTVPSLRRLPFTIRLSPQFANRLLSRTQRADSSYDSIHGLLFGLSDESLLVVQAFRSFGEDGGSIHGMTDGAPRHDELFEQLLTTARKDPEISPLELVGWYTVRVNGGLLQSDIQFHDRYFKRLGDLALVLKPEGNTDVLCELYCRSANGGLSDEAHRWGAVRLTYGSPLVGPVEVTMRAKIQDDFFMRAYEATHPEGESDQLSRWKRVVRGLLPVRKQDGLPKPAMALAPQQLPPGTRPKGETVAPGAVSKQLSSSPRKEERANVNTGPLQKVYAGPPPSVPALVPDTSAGRRAPWISSAVIFAVAAGLTFGLVYTGGLSSGDNLPGFLKGLFPAPKLGLHLESQGDRVLLSWNRHHPAVRNAKGGVLQIDDGPQHRLVSLDAAQVSNGSVLYRPNSDDVTFRLEVESAQGGKVSESMRVLEAAKPSTLDLSAPAPNASVSRATEPPGQTSSAPVQKSTAVIAPKPGAATANSPDVNPVAAPRQLGHSPNAAPLPEQKPLEAPAKKADTSGDVAFDVLPPAPAQTEKNEPALTLGNSAPTPSAETATRQTESIRNPSQSEANSALPPATERQNPVAPPIHPPVPAVESAPSVTSSYRAPRPLRQVLPNIALLAPTVLSTAGRIEVIVKVDERGHVTEAHLANGARKINASLAGASILAARQWTFAPATLGGKAVPSQHSIVFQFQPNK